MKYVTVRVTQDDIERGVRWNKWACPLAIAVARKGFQGATVLSTYWMADAYDPKTFANLPRRATGFVRAFDAGKPVQPATFRLPLP